MRRTLERWIRRSRWPWLLIPLLAVPAMWPYTQGFPSTADGFLHLLRTALLDEHIRQGMLYPRWTPELVLGYGYPVFNFYGPITYYLAEGLHLLGLGYYQALMGTFCVMIVVAGYGMYLLARDALSEPGNEWAALAAAVAYMYGPYLLTNVYIRMAIGEVGAQALLPWIFWSFRRLLRHPRPAQWVLPAALSLAGLATAHNITLILLPPALLGYCLVIWWQTGHRLKRMAWVAAGGAAAMGLSAFFWLPLIGERQYLSQTAYSVARQFLPENAWTWRNFIDLSFVFDYTAVIPFQLGLVQLGLAIAGFWLALRRDVEWIFLFGLTVLACLGIGAWAVPLWLSNNVLLVAQFPWRLLSLASVPLALFTGGSLLHVPAGRWQATAGLTLLALIIVANHPQLPQPPQQVMDNAAINPAAIAQFELITGGLGTGSAHEFFPRWVKDLELDSESAALTAPAEMQIDLVSASPYERNLAVNAAAPTQLRFADFYYPGWQAQLDTGAALKPYPTTSLGLLTVDLPAGSHYLHVSWQDTPLRRGATWLSLVTAAILAVFLLAQARARWLASVPMLLLLGGAMATFKPLPATADIQIPAETVSNGALQLLGYREEQRDSDHIYLYPYWYTHAHPPRYRMNWQITDRDGKVLSETVTEPYFGGSHSDLWPAGTLVDDAYRLSLPPGLAAGTYGLQLQWLPYAGTVTAAAPMRVGVLQLEAVPTRQPPTPAHSLKAQFSSDIRLAGYDVRLNAKPVDEPVPVLPVRRGDRLTYTLFWQLLKPVSINYHAFIHLLDANVGVLAKRDQLAGAWWFYAPVLWDVFHLQPDTYLLPIPSDAAGGVYWPHVGVYEFDTLQLLPVTDETGQSVGDTYTLPAIKVVPPDPPAPKHVTAARFEDLATLWGYDLTAPAAGLHAGDTFTLTLYYRSESSTTASYTRFVHFSNSESGLAAQADAVPQQGLNPTWAWVPGEVIVDRVTLTVSPQAAPGTYKLDMGLYDAASDGARLAVSDRDGNLLPESQVTLAQLEVVP